MRDEDGEMTEIHDDMGPPRAPVRKHSVHGPTWRKIRDLLEQGKTEAEIVRISGIQSKIVRRHVASFAQRRMRRAREAPDVEAGRYLMSLDRIIERRTGPQQVGTRKVKVKDAEDNETEVEEPILAPPAPADDKTAIQAIDRASKLLGLDAPSRSESLNVTARLQNASPDLMANARYRELLLEKEELERAIALQGSGHDAGRVRGEVEPRALESRGEVESMAPRQPDESNRDEGGLRRD